MFSKSYFSDGVNPLRTPLWRHSCRDWISANLVLVPGELCFEDVGAELRCLVQRCPQGKCSVPWAAALGSDTQSNRESLMSVIAWAVLFMTQLSLYMRCTWWAFYTKQNVCSKPQVKSFCLFLKSLFDIYLRFEFVWISFNYTHLGVLWYSLN